MQGPAPAGGGRGDGSVAAPVPTGRSAGRRRWGAVLALAAAVLFLGVLDGFPLVALPLGVLLLGLGSRPRGWLLGAAALAWALAVTPAGGFGLLSRGWGLLLGGAFLAVTLARPRWPFFSRALAALGAGLAGVGVWLGLTGGWARLDWAMTEHLRSLAALTAQEALGRFPDARWAQDLSAMSGRIVEAQGAVFPALLALQSLAALALAWWAFGRSRGTTRGPALGLLREFRFHDALVWLLIAGLLLLVLPLGEGAVRAGANVLLFMGALYVLRGFAVFLFLARGAPPLPSLVLGALAAVFFYPIVFTAALLVGLGDTWLDVRGRAVAGSRA